MAGFTVEDLVANAFILGNKIPASHPIWDKIQDTVRDQTLEIVSEGNMLHGGEETGGRPRKTLKKDFQIKPVQEETRTLPDPDQELVKREGGTYDDKGILTILKKQIAEYKGCVISQKDFVSLMAQILGRPRFSGSPLDRNFPMIKDKSWRCFSAFCFYPGVPSKFIQCIYLFPKDEDIDKDITEMKLLEYCTIRDKSRRPWQFHLDYAPRPRLLNLAVPVEKKQQELQDLNAEIRKGASKAIRWNKTIQPR